MPLLDDDGWWAFLGRIAWFTFKCLLVVVVVFVTVWFALRAVASERPCYESRPWSRHDNKQMVRCLVDEIDGIPGGYVEARRIASCESGWNEKEDNNPPYVGLWQTEPIEQEHWSIPGAPHWARVLLDEHPGWRSAASRTNPYRSSLVTLSHTAGPEGWSWVGSCN